VARQREDSRRFIPAQLRWEVRFTSHPERAIVVSLKTNCYLDLEA
jgi:hypothetical protein